MQQALNQKSYRALELPKILELLGALCHCEDSVTMAREILPCTRLDQAQEKLRQTVEAYEFVARYGSPSFGGLVNVNNCLTRAAAGGVLSMGELLRIAEVLRVIRSLAQWRQNYASESRYLSPDFEVLCPNPYLENKISNAIISEEEMSDRASPALAEIRRKKQSAAAKIREKLDQMIRSKTMQKLLQEPIVTQRSGRFVIPVKAECRGEVPGLVHDTSASGSTVFVEPAVVVEANNQIKVLEAAEREEIERILEELSQEVGGFDRAIVTGFEACCRLDVIFAKAKLAFDMKASEPLLNDQGIIDIKKARHPLLDPAKVVAVDIRLGEGFDTLVVTGPNTGGKTVSLKTLGLLTLMAACGLMIPAGDESRVCIFGGVFADIGDEQSIEQDLSTFSAHMKNMIAILQAADEHSLVLADELGSGTDPIEGAALARAILEKLRRIGARVVATTHYAELKAFALETPGVENACCEFDVATLRPTYRLLIGMPGRSNAFAILQRLGMEPSVVERSKELVSTENRQFEQVVQTLERSHAGLEEEREEARRLRAEAAALAARAQTEREQLKTEKEKILEQARRQSRDLLDRTRAESRALLDELETLKKQADGLQAAEMLRRARASVSGGLNRLADTADPVEERERDGYRLPRPLKIGDTVLLADVDKQGTVLTLPDDAGMLFVQAGIIKTKVSVDTLRLVNKEKVVVPKTPKPRIGMESRGLRQVKTELDIRGLAVDEALPLVDQFIDGAVLSGLETVTIIHGKGTGVLKNAVRQHLRTHRSVSAHRRGQYGEGEDGVTVVTIK